MLLGQNSGWHQKGNLLAIPDGLEGGPHGHFSFSIAHVATKEAVHGSIFFHVFFDVSDGCQLIRSLLPGEVILKFLLDRIIGRKSITGIHGPAGVKFQEFFRHVLNRLLDPGLGSLPVAASQFVELGAFFFAADKFLQIVGLLHGHIKFVLSPVFNKEVVIFYALNIQAADAKILADAVGGVDHKVADFQVSH